MPFPIKIASRLDPIKPSITLAVTAKAAKLKADGIDVISFGAGEPDFDTPAHIKDAARASLDKGQVAKYTEVEPGRCRVRAQLTGALAVAKSMGPPHSGRLFSTSARAGSRPRHPHDQAEHCARPAGHHAAGSDVGDTTHEPRSHHSPG